MAFVSQTSHSDVERGHRWSSRGCDFSSPSKLSKKCRPLHHWVDMFVLSAVICSYFWPYSKMTIKTVSSLQEVYSGPVRFISDMVFNDPWSQKFMSTLAPLNYVKVLIYTHYSCQSLSDGKPGKIQCIFCTFMFESSVLCVAGVIH